MRKMQKQLPKPSTSDADLDLLVAHGLLQDKSLSNFSGLVSTRFHLLPPINLFFLSLLCRQGFVIPRPTFFLSFLSPMGFKFTILPRTGFFFFLLLLTFVKSMLEFLPISFFFVIFFECACLMVKTLLFLDVLLSSLVREFLSLLLLSLIRSRTGQRSGFIFQSLLLLFLTIFLLFLLPFRFGRISFLLLKLLPSSLYSPELRFCSSWA